MIVCPLGATLSLWGDSGDLRASLHTAAACLLQRGTFVSAKHQHSLPTTSVSPSAACRDEAKQLIIFFSGSCDSPLYKQRRKDTQKHKYSVSDNTETKSGLRVQAHTRKMSFSKSSPALLCRLIFYSLTTCFHWGRWDKEKLLSTPPPPLSWTQIQTLLQSHTSPTVCYRRTGMWLAQKADGSLNQSQWVCESWQIVSWKKNYAHGEAWGAQSETLANLESFLRLITWDCRRTPVCPHMHTQVPLHSCCLFLGYCEERDYSLGSGGWKVGVTAALCRHYSRSIPGIASTQGTEAAFICTIFSPWLIHENA